MSDKVKRIDEITDLQQDPVNANIGTERGLYVLDDSLAEVGAGRSIVADRTGTVLAGNKTLQVAADKGFPVRVVQTDGTELVVVQRTDLDLSGEGDEQRRAQRLALLDNFSSAVGLEWDPAVLLSLAQDDGDLTDGLWRPDEWEELLGDLFEPPDDEPPPLAQLDKADGLQQKWGVKVGDLWEIGRHRLVCGDCTDGAVVERVMGGERAQVTFTDPPYNVGKDYGQGTDDQKKQVDYISFCADWFNTLDSECIVFTPGTVNLGVWYSIRKPKWVCVWVKLNQCSPSAINGYNAWEPILIYGKNPKPVGHDVWQIPVKIESVGHPVNKTASAWATFLDAFSNVQDLVYDPFCGSGTTLVACEQLNRRGRGVEIEPRYCSVTLERLSAMGLEPIRVAE